MTTDWERVNQLFHQALECRSDERAEFIARASEDDPALRRELQSLLSVHEEDNGFLETPVMRVSLSPQFGRWQGQIVEALAGHPAKAFPPSDQMIGQLLDAKYRIEELCGRGGMGAVYRATHVGTGRSVAVKVIAPELAGNSEFIERFRQEAKTIGRLRHPNIVNVTDFGITGAGDQTLAYLVMEYLEGGTLSTRLKSKRPIPLDEALAILTQTCAAIDEAHRHGILHRDLKPENIWLEPAASGSNVKVLDFGIAQLHDFLAPEEREPLPAISETAAPAEPQPFSITEDETLRLNLTARNLTRAGTAMGTPKYMSPEQCRGEKLGPASDVYSLGVIAYQMLSGEPPFTGTVAELLSQHREIAPAPLRDKRRNIPAAVDAVVCQALAKEPEARPATAGAFAFLLNLQTAGNGWLREQADAVSRQHRYKLAVLAVRLQWPGWLLTGLILMATVKLPGMRPALTVAVFGLLWLAITATTLWRQNAVTAACTLYVEQTRKTAKNDADARGIVRTVRQRSGALAGAAFAGVSGIVHKLCSFRPAQIRRWADCLLIVPPLVQEGLSVRAAAERSAALIEPVRRKAVYPFFRRLIAVALVLTAWQVMLMFWGDTLDGGRRQLREAIFFKLPVILAVCFTAFSLGLKSSIEQAVLYLTARQALGEVTADSTGLHIRQDAETRPRGWWPWVKTYVPACALVVLLGGFQFIKFPVMTNAVNSGNIHTVKALHASGAPLPLQASYVIPPFWLRLFPRRFLPYGPSIIQSWAMTKFLIEKGVDVNTRIVMDGSWTPPGIGPVTMPPLLLALTAGNIPAARLLIEHGADLRARDSIGRSALTVAITYYPQAIGLLLDSGADINEQTRFGTPLLTAARYQWLYQGRRATREQSHPVRILLEKGADPNTRDGEGRNALMVMSMEQRRDEFAQFRSDGRGHGGSMMTFANDEAVKLIGEALLNAGCEINAADSKGRTPLMYAVRYNRPAAVSLLLRRGADKSIRDGSGMTALDLATQAGNKEIIGLFSSPGKDSPHNNPHNKSERKREE
ncbi:MAG TPA: protein kinase [Blastocatellia bacterium]|nr:protein kinase [Blastocatellia bacterium]